MSIATNKKGLPLKSVVEIPVDIVAKLATLSITTCEEFISAIHSNPAGYANFLGISKDRLLELYTVIKDKIPDDLAKELEAPVENYAYGATSPYSDEFETYMKQDEGE
jgi:hypothetical protein